MPPPLRYTLVADGSSDKALIPIIDWLIADRCPDQSVQGTFAESLNLGDRDLARRIAEAARLYPCDLMIVHRDAERESLENRAAEIARQIPTGVAVWVPLVPVRMTEAWMFSDESAIRSASENSHGRIELNLPRKDRWEEIPDPKQILFDILVTASEKSQRALRRFNPARQRFQVTQRTQDFSNLRGVRSFDEFEEKLIVAIQGIQYALD